MKVDGRCPVNDTILRAARELIELPTGELHKRAGRNVKPSRLRQIVNGKAKSVDVEWWRKLHGVHSKQETAKQEKAFQKKLDAIKAMADPISNPNEHQRRMAEEMLIKVQAAGPKAAQIRSAPGLEEYDRAEARFLAALDRGIDEMFVRMRNAAKPQAASRLGSPKPSVNTAAKVKLNARPRPVHHQAQASCQA
jgi:hypothetical protein